MEKFYMIKMKNLKAKKGIALPISLFVLMGVTLAAAALIRTGEFGITMAGDIAHRSIVSGHNDVVAATALNWLNDNKGTLNNTNSAQGYFSSTSPSVIDYTREESWLNARKLPTDANGNTSSYLIFRMCSLPNTPYNGSLNGVQNQCAIKESTQASGTDGNSSGFQGFSFTSNTLQIYYRVIVRTVGPKDATSITETVVAMNI